MTPSRLIGAWRETCLGSLTFPIRTRELDARSHYRIGWCTICGRDFKLHGDGRLRKHDRR